MDLTFQTPEGRFNYRVCAIIIHDNHILAMHDECSPYYYLPGGRVQLQETAEKAVLREIKEELGIDAEIIRPLWFHQGFFTEDVSSERFHEVCLYFLVDISGSDVLSRGNKFVLNERNHRHTFEWLEFHRLKEAYFYPVFLKERIFHLPDTLTLMTEYES